MTVLKLSEIIHEGQSSTNFWSIVHVIAKGYWAKVGSDISSSLEMTGPQSWSIGFSSISLNKKRKKSMLQLWKPVISRLVKIWLPTLTQEPLTIT